VAFTDPCLELDRHGLDNPRLEAPADVEPAQECPNPGHGSSHGDRLLEDRIGRGDEVNAPEASLEEADHGLTAGGGMIC
jgi:hypothetical protein